MVCGHNLHTPYYWSKSFFLFVFLQKQLEDAKLSAVISEVVSQTPAPTNHSAGPPPDTPVSNRVYEYFSQQQQQGERK